jgi:ABC-type protease/lipase transport system fused ATPase/permease subunit
MLRKNPSIKRTLYICLVHMLLSMFSSFERNMFFDIYLGMSLVGNIFIWMHVNLIFSFKLIIGNNNNNNKNKTIIFINDPPKITNFFLGYSMQTFIDIWWMIVYMMHWWSSDYIDGRSLSKLRVLTLVSSILLFIVRIIMMLFIYRVGSIKIETEEKNSLSNQYNKGIRNDDFFLTPAFSQDSSMMEDGKHRELGESMLVN